MEKNYFNDLCQIYSTKKFDYELFIQLENLKPNVINTLKKYLLNFLIDDKDKKGTVKSFNEFWFNKEQTDNYDLIIKYLDFNIQLIQSNNIFFKPKILLEIFQNTLIENKLIFINLIIQRYDLPNIILISFLGYLIGEKKEFIKEKYVNDLNELLNFGKLNELKGEPDFKCLDEQFFQIINLFTYFLVCKKESNIEISYLNNIICDYSKINKLNLYYFFSKKTLRIYLKKMVILMK